MRWGLFSETSAFDEATMNGEDIRAYMKAAIDESSSPGSCASVEQLTAYLRNECDDGKREWIQGHLVSCDECRSVLLDLSGFVTAAVQAPQGAAEPGVDRLARHAHHHDRWPDGNPDTSTSYRMM